MRYRRLMLALLIAVAASIGACGGGDDDTDAVSTTTPSGPPATATATATPSGSAGQLPPAFVKCMAEQGFDVTSSADIHSAPPDLLQMCFGTLHGGGG